MEVVFYPPLQTCMLFTLQELLPSCTSFMSLLGNLSIFFTNSQKYNLRNVQKPEKTSAIFCRKDCGPCFGSLGEDIWCRTEFLTRKGKLHKDKAKGRKCSFNTQFDYELNNGEPDFKLVELEAFLFIPN